MAIIDDDNKKAATELKAIDINDTSLPEGKEDTLNADADAWGRSCPPPDGVYEVRLFESKTPYQIGETDDGGVFYKANLECSILQEGEWKDTKVFANVSTFISQGKEISTMAAIIRKCIPSGNPIPPKATPLQILRLFRKVVGQQPRLYCQGEWKAWDKYKEDWIVVGMARFPKLGEGKYNHLVRDSKGNEVAANFKVNRWFGIKEYKALLEAEKLRKAKGGAQVQQTRQANGTSGGEVVGGFQAVDLNSNTSAPASVGMADSDFVIDE
jgi:hypothetical protein